MYALGIDGGGTKTAFALADPTGTVCAKVICGDFNPDGGTRESWIALLEQALHMLAVEPQEIGGVCAGIPRWGELEEREPCIREAFRSVFSCPVQLLNDVELALLGAQECGSGIHIVCGTGAMGVARLPDGTFRRAGGWSEQFSDEGSGYWIGMQAFALFSRQADGRMKKDAFYDLFRRALQIDRDMDAIARFYAEYQPVRAKVASLQRVMLEAARCGAESVRGVLRQAGDELFLLTMALTEGFSRFPVTVTVSGRVLEHNEFVRDQFTARCAQEKNVSLQPGKRTACEGAALQASIILKESELCL